MTEPNQQHKRRVRYSGTHPRRHEEKYKELNPDRYREEVQKVIARGQTPAGMHIPICVKEILGILNPQPGQRGLDATLGYGGHAFEILKRIVPGGRLVAIDVDPVELPRTEKRLRDLGYDDRVLQIKRMNFAGIARITTQTSELFDFILADLGVSSMQLDTPSRGFSYKTHGPLDLRLNPKHGQPASKLIRSLDEKSLEKLLQENSDEPYSEKLARAITVNAGNIETTTELANIIRKELAGIKPRLSDTEIKKSLQRTFQALRIAVNDEFGALKSFLKLLPDCLKSGGRVAILTFHSGEDRLVKKSFQAGFRSGIYRSIAAEPGRPSAEERRANPRSSCAKLRWAIKA